MANNALIWDESGKREFQSGVNSVALYVMNNNGGYGDGVAWNGVTAISENPSGADATDLYADNIKYATLRSAERFGFTIEAYTYPEEWGVCDGSASPMVGVYLGQQGRKAFGLAYKTYIGDDVHPGMDKGYNLHIVWNSTASPSSRSYATINENPDAISFSWEATSNQVGFVSEDYKNYKPVSTITINSTKVDETNLKALEAILFGGDAKPMLPTPDQVLKVLATGSL